MTVWEVLQPWLARGGRLLFDFLKWQLFSFLVHEGLCLLADGDGSLRSQALRQEWFIVQRAHKRAVSKKLSRKALKKLIKKLGKEFGIWATLAVLLLENLSQVKSVLRIIAGKAVAIYAATWALSRAAAYSAHVYLRPWQAACAVFVAYALRYLLGLDLEATYAAARPALHAACSLTTAAARDILHWALKCYRLAATSLLAGLGRRTAGPQPETASSGKRSHKSHHSRRRSVDQCFSTLQRSDRSAAAAAAAAEAVPVAAETQPHPEALTDGDTESEASTVEQESSVGATGHWRKALRRCRVDAHEPYCLGRRRIPFRRRALHPLPPARWTWTAPRGQKRRTGTTGQKRVWQPQKLLHLTRVLRPRRTVPRGVKMGSMGTTDLTISRATSDGGSMVFSLEQWPSLMADLLTPQSEEELLPRGSSDSRLRFYPLQPGLPRPGLTRTSARRNTVHS